MNLRRIISSGSYIPEIDGLRCLAILAVVLYHIPGNWLTYSAARYPEESAALSPAVSPFYAFGYEGVLLFFVISGFILGLPFARQRLAGGSHVSLRRFYIRRVTRLEPPYAISMLLFFGMGVLLGRFDLLRDLPHLGASLLYIHNIVFQSESTINVAAWSLEVEIQFYLLAPLLCWMMLRNRLFSLMLLPPAVVLWSLVQYILPAKPITILSYAHYFLAGMFAAGLVVTFPKFVERRSWLWDAALAVALIAFFLVARYIPSAGAIIYPWIFAGLLLCGIKSIFGSAILRTPLIATTGGMCYTIYLYHGRLITLPMVFLLSKWKFSGNYTIDILILTALLVPFVLGISALLFAFLERPFMAPAWPEKVGTIWRAAVSRFFGARATALAPNSEK